MKPIRYLVMTLFLFVFSASKNYAQLEPQCNNIIGQAYSVPAGSMSCTAYFLNPQVDSIGVPVTRCFSYLYNGPIRLNYLLVTGQCGPFALYNVLTFKIYNQACDTLITTGSILPTNANTYIDYLVIGQWYNFCYTWIPNCPQTAACPLIYTSLLPIELANFSVKAYEDYNEIIWSTHTEINNQYFLLERSNDAKNWEEIFKINGAGNSTNLIEYEFSDTNPFAGLNYYKLKQIDFDGQYSYSNIISANAIKSNQFFIYPNPAKNVLHVFFVSEKQGNYTVEIVSTINEQLFIKEIITNADGNKLEINLSNYSKGLYLIRIINNNNLSQKIFKFHKN